MKNRIIPPLYFEDLSKTRTARKYFQANRVARAKGTFDPMTEYYDARADASDTKGNPSWPEDNKKIKEYRENNSMDDNLNKDRIVRTTTPEEDAEVKQAIERRKAWDKKRSGDYGKYKKLLSEGAKEMKRSYTIDEMTAATMLKGHPDAQAILDELNKGKKAKNESGQEFQDGSEDTIGSEGHESNVRSVDHVTGSGGNPGVTTKRASMEDGDLEKSDNLTDNLPEEFEDEMETDEERLPDAGKSLDDQIVNFLAKSWGDETIDKALIGGRNLDPGQTAKVHAEPAGHTGGVKDPAMLKRAAEEKEKMKANALKRFSGTTSQVKSENDFDIEKSEGDTQMSKEWSMEFSKSVLENMGLEKGSPDKSAKIDGQKVRQISYESEPETRVHKKGAEGKPEKDDSKRYVYKKKTDEIQARERNKETGKMEDKGKPVSIGDQEKLRSMKSQIAELYKSLEELLDEE